MNEHYPLHSAHSIHSLPHYYEEIFTVSFNHARRCAGFGIPTLRVNFLLTHFSFSKQVASDLAQFTKLPKLISDRIFKAFTRSSKAMNLTNFLQCFKLVSGGIRKEKYQLLYQMADFDEDGVITVGDLLTVLNHCQSVFQEYSGLPDIMSSESFTCYEYEDTISLKDLQSDSFDVLVSKVRCASYQTFTFIEDVLDIRRRLNNYVTFINRSLSFQQNKENALHCQGKMYRLTKGSYLKKYYYKILAEMLYVYRKKEDQAPKTVLCLTKAIIQRCEPEVTSDEAQKRIYALKIIQPSGKTRIFYFLEEKERQEWRMKLLQATGQTGEFIEFYEMFEKLGEGLEGQVRRAVHKQSKKQVAVKIIKRLVKDPQQQLLLQLGKRLKHSGLTQFCEVFESPERTYFVYQYCEGGTLLQYLLSGKPSEQIVRGMSQQLVSLLIYLKRYNVIHRDLKPENILLTGNFLKDTQIPEIKLTDFGLSGILGKGETSVQSFGTLLYAAPQILYEHPHNFQADVYSLGVIMYAMCSCKVPFNRKNPQQLVEDILNKQPIFGKNFEDFSKELILIIKRMLRKFPHIRPTIEEVEQALDTTLIRAKTLG